MARTFATTLKILLLSAGATVSALSAGCAGEGASTQPSAAVKPVTVSGNPRVVAVAQPTAVASANNARDLADAQPETVIGPARDLDLGGGDQPGNGGGDNPGGGGGGNPGGGGGNPGAGGQPLTVQDLGALLQQLGVNAQSIGNGYVIKVKASTPDGINWAFPITVSLSQDQSLVWIACPLVTVSGYGAPSQSLMNLLSANFQLGSVFFAVAPNQSLMLQGLSNNVGITAPVLGARLKYFFICLKMSEPAYKVFFNNSQGGGGGGGPFQ